MSTDNWKQVNQNGFLGYGPDLSTTGSTTELFSFNSQLYATNSDGLFRMLDSQYRIWEELFIPVEKKDSWHISNVGNYIYLICTTHDILWRIEKNKDFNNINWIKINKNYDSPIKPLVIFNGKIYGVMYYMFNEKSRFKIVSSADIDSITMNWDLASNTNMDKADFNNSGIAFLTVYNNRLVAGTNAHTGLFELDDNYLTGGVQVWESYSGKMDSWNKINIDGFGTKVQSGDKTFVVNQLIGCNTIYKAPTQTQDYLYIGTKTPCGAEVWRYDGNGLNGWVNVTPSWAEVSYYRSPIRDESMNVYQDKLYLAEDYPTANLSIYDGTTWEIIVYGPNPFDPQNGGLQSLAVNLDRNYVSTTHDPKYSIGAQVWGYPFQETPEVPPTKEEVINKFFESQLVCGNTAVKVCSTAEGTNTVAIGNSTHSEGNTTIAYGDHSHAEGYTTQSIGKASHAEGNNNFAIGDFSHAEGSQVKAIGIDSHAEGLSTTASGENSHAEGSSTTASGEQSHAEGSSTLAEGTSSHAEGSSTIAEGTASHVEGFKNKSVGENSHAEGSSNISSGKNSHAEGDHTEASGIASHAENLYTMARGIASHTEGIFTLATGDNSHAEGEFTKAYEKASHAEGYSTIASGKNSHAEGALAEARATNSHAEGYMTIADGMNSHVEGFSTKAVGEQAHAEGYHTIATNDGNHVMGKYGSDIPLNPFEPSASYSWYLANGINESNPGLAAKILNSGNAYIDHNWNSGGADYAEMFETMDSLPIDVGYFVTLEDEKVRKATSKDSYILGVISATPGIIGNIGELRWKDKFITDEWNRIQYHEVTVQAILDNEGKEIVPARIEIQPILNPDYDPQIPYLPRRLRDEWVTVGVIGQILVRDDGTCKVNGYCMPNDDGVATVSETGYRVLKRTGENQILVFFK